MNAIYHGTTGYSSLDAIDAKKTAHILRVNKRIIEGYRQIRRTDLLLVAGAGNGLEAVILNKVFGTKTFAVDLNIGDSVRANNKEVAFDRQDLSDLRFPEGEFDVVYCVHVLEHVNDHIQVIKELHRVTKPNGLMFIGFPNKNRILGYIGTNDSASILQRIRWNLHDYKDRIRGKFENRLGAHAGFTQKEFLRDAGAFFSRINVVRNEYMLRKYLKYEMLVKFLIATGLAEITFPSNYFVCIK
jgi:SAM-dependent methyltransferase